MFLYMTESLFDLCWIYISWLLRPPYANDIVHSLGRSSYCAFFCIGLASRRDLGCFLYHSEKILTHPTPLGLTELARIHYTSFYGNLAPQIPKCEVKTFNCNL